MADERKTPVFDWLTGEFKTDPQGRVVTVTGIFAAEQVIIKAQQTARGFFRIYRNTENPKLNHKYGNDAWTILTRPDVSNAVRYSELRRAIREAVIYDPWITDVTDVVVTRRRGSSNTAETSDELDIAFTVRTIYDEELTLRGVVPIGY